MDMFCCVLEDTDYSVVDLRNLLWNDNHLHSNCFAAITKLLAALQYLTTHKLSVSSALLGTVTMSLQTTFLTLLLVYFKGFSSSNLPQPNTARKSGCFKVSTCKCIMKDGSGVIDLKAMGDADGFLGRLEPVSVASSPVSVEMLLSFSPCLPFSQPEEPTTADCIDVAACLTVR